MPGELRHTAEGSPGNIPTLWFRAKATEAGLPSPSLRKDGRVPFPGGATQGTSKFHKGSFKEAKGTGEETSERLDCASLLSTVCA